MSRSRYQFQAFPIAEDGMITVRKDDHCLSDNVQLSTALIDILEQSYTECKDLVELITSIYIIAGANLAILSN